MDMTVFPLMLLKSKTLKENRVLINHEKIHLKQQLELLIIPFFVIYVLEFYIRLLQYKNRKMAYRNFFF